MLCDDAERIGVFYDEQLKVSSPLENLSCFTASKNSGNQALDLDSSIVKVTFTSGTSGRPTGVCLSEASIAGVAFALSAALQDVPN